MIEELKSDEIVKKVGGRFKLAVLLQKRMVDVAFGAPLLVSSAGKTLAEAIVQEIMEGKISLDLSAGILEVRTDEEETAEIEDEDE